jgi:hypothetical protein
MINLAGTTNLKNQILKTTRFPGMTQAIKHQLELNIRSFSSEVCSLVSKSETSFVVWARSFLSFPIATSDDSLYIKQKT